MISYIKYDSFKLYNDHSYYYYYNKKKYLQSVDIIYRKTLKS